MAKGRHAKDKLWLTPTERQEAGMGGYQAKSIISQLNNLPFDCCALTLQAAVSPVMSPDGFVFDAKNVIKFIKTYGKHPVTGEKLSVRSLRPIYFEHNDADDIVCPVTQKVFNQHTHIVVNTNNGRVYSYDAIKELCINLKNKCDPLDNSPLDIKEDLVDIQNPKIPRATIDKEVFFNNLELLNLHGLSDNPNEVSSATSKPKIQAMPMTEKVKKIMEEKGGRGLLAMHRAMKTESKDQSSKGGIKSRIHTTGNIGAASTSTVANIATSIEYRHMTEMEIRQEIYAKIKKEKIKGYARIETTLGSLSLMLHCDKAPIACHNFILLAKSGYYKNHDIHRILPCFVMQTGDPEGEGFGGTSAWGEPFKNEFHPDLNHVGRGVVGMANSGPNSNTSQFYITFASASHLDKVHTVFATVIGNMETLDKIEKVPQKKGRPKKDSMPKMIDITVYKDPYTGEEDETEVKNLENGDTDEKKTIQELMGLSSVSKRRGEYIDTQNKERDTKSRKYQ